ncbi:restriction endonuclease subunit S [Helicobacter cetorum]|uniref:restriction endonuclease subunit S n=1 Tax=Helicobacter cetorum TaxID=138563 RepID=UPI000CF0D079|nr:restriction endonuclease subunit S [Helicobacter cetorum]
MATTKICYRFKNFSGEWEIKSFREVSKVNQGLQIPISKRLKRPSKNSKFYITIQALKNAKEVEYIESYSDSVVCHKDDVLMTRTGNTGMVVSGVEGVFHNNFFKINFDFYMLDKDFLIQFLNTEKTQRIILMKAGASTIPDLKHNDFYNITIPLPPLKEQQKIGNFFKTLDNLIDKHTKKLNKLKDLKKHFLEKML